jgi:copper chaperone CopZ
MLAWVSAAGAEPAKTQTAKFGIEGMTCSACATAAKVALKKLDGVTDAKVSFDDKEAVVEYLEGKVTLEQMVEAVNGLGYKATAKSELGKDK